MKETEVNFAIDFLAGYWQISDEEWHDGRKAVKAMIRKQKRKGLIK